MSEAAARPRLKQVAAYDAGALTLVGPRVTLRRPEPGDAPRVAALMNDYDVVKNLSRAPWPYGPQDAAEWLAHIAAPNAARGDYPFAVVTGEGLVGVVGISTNPQNSEGVELGYWFGRPYWGQGYATEAARLALEFAFRELDLQEIDAGHFADNAASGRVLQKLGFAYTEDAPRFSKARNCEVACRMMILPRSRFAEGRANQEGTRHGG